MGSEYETGSRARPSGRFGELLSGPILERNQKSKPVYRIHCGCTYLGTTLLQSCPQHTQYVIQEEP